MIHPLFETFKVLPRIATRLRRPTWRSLGCKTRGLCHACGAVTEFPQFEVLPAALAEDWRLTPDMKAAMDRRESGPCTFCGSRFRARQLARGLVELYGRQGEASVAELARSEPFRSTKILGVDLEFLPMLEACPGFSRSNYITSLLPARGLPDRGLPFADASLDLVLTSDTLEHIPRHRRVLEEIRRVLTPGGRFVTVQPVILSRKTVTRCVVDEGGAVRHLLPPSYHCRGADDSLVFVEFGIDFLDDIEAAGLDLTVYFYNVPAGRPGLALRHRLDGGHGELRPAPDRRGRCLGPRIRLRGDGARPGPGAKPPSAGDPPGSLADQSSCERALPEPRLRALRSAGRRAPDEARRPPEAFDHIPAWAAVDPCASDGEFFRAVSRRRPFHGIDRVVGCQRRHEHNMRDTQIQSTGRRE